MNQWGRHIYDKINKIQENRTRNRQNRCHKGK